MFILAAALLLLGAFWWFSSSHPSSRTDTEARQSLNVPSSTFHGYECIGDCSGHEAGYNWAEEHDIQDGDDCDAAGEHSNSPSFAEGCHAYVDGENVAEPNDEDTEDTPE